MSVQGDWLLTPTRVAVHLPTATAVLSDLHLGYAEARRGNGDAVPVADLEDILAPLQAILSRLAVRRLVIAGDLFEAGPRRVGPSATGVGGRGRRRIAGRGPRQSRP